MTRVRPWKPVEQRTPRVVNLAHRARVLQLGCLVCGHRPVEGHHLLRGTSKRGLSRRADDTELIPLCPRHHRQLHNAGDEDKFFEQKMGNPDAGRDYAALLTQKTRPPIKGAG